MDVKEGSKGRSMGSHLQLGTPLTIATSAGTEDFEDLDEIVARYVEPYAATVRSIVGHRHAPGSLLFSYSCFALH